jgi:hypothetical protein
MKRPNRSAAHAIAEVPPAQPEPGEFSVSTPEPEPEPAPLASVMADAPTLPIDRIIRDPELNLRSGGIAQAIVKEYAAAIKLGASFPPVVVFQDAEGKAWLADGFHRCAGHELAGLTEITIDLREGGRREALLHAAGCNASHGKRRSRADVKKAVLAVLADPEWSTKSDRWIGEVCAVHNETIASYRKQRTDSVSSAERVGKDGKTRRAPKASKVKKPPKVDRVVRLVRRDLDRVVKDWPRDVDRAPLLEAAKAWVLELENAFSNPQAPTGRPTDLVKDAAE